MKIKDLTEREANELSDKAKFIKKTYAEDYDSLWYELEDQYIEVYVTRDKSCWVMGGALFDSKKDIE